ncbi:MarR family winged helix-turn-helix transcriptional regulator [Euzebya sp.]|uniref:MarR family winged helix-turn-helix transcriptional regulator n=1 Tax=Euzebya sp. TaxID=1971409 RepID=UPI003516B8A3
MEQEGRGAVVKDVVRMMFELTGMLRAHMDRSAAALDLTPMQARALFVTHIPVPMRQVADALHCDASNITGIVDRLEERGLMRRVTDPEDRRRRNLLITDEGKVVNERLRDLLRDGNPVLALDDDEIEVLHGLLLKVLASGTPADVVDRRAAAEEVADRAP